MGVVFMFKAKHPLVLSFIISLISLFIMMLLSPYVAGSSEDALSYWGLGCFSVMLLTFSVGFISASNMERERFQFLRYVFRCFGATTIIGLFITVAVMLFT